MKVGLVGLPGSGSTGRISLHRLALRRLVFDDGELWSHCFAGDNF